MDVAGHQQRSEDLHRQISRLQAELREENRAFAAWRKREKEAAARGPQPVRRRRKSVPQQTTFAEIRVAAKAPEVPVKGARNPRAWTPERHALNDRKNEERAAAKAAENVKKPLPKRHYTPSFD